MSIMQYYVYVYRCPLDGHPKLQHSENIRIANVHISRNCNCSRFRTVVDMYPVLSASEKSWKLRLELLLLCIILCIWYDVCWGRFDDIFFLIIFFVLNAREMQIYRGTCIQYYVFCVYIIYTSRQRAFIRRTYTSHTSCCSSTSACIGILLILYTPKDFNIIYKKYKLFS